MADKRPALGRGLSALIPDSAGEDPSRAQKPFEIDLDRLTPNPQQPRSAFDEASLEELAQSIRRNGVIQPILARRARPQPGAEGDTRFEIIAGERRWRAARRVGLQTIPALLRTTDDAATLEQALVENVHRADLNPLEEAAAYQQLIEDFQLTHEQVAARVGRSRVAITNTLRLLQLPPAIQKLIQDDALREGHARALLGTPDRAFQEQLARRAVNEGLSVRAVEEAVRAHTGEAEKPGGRRGTPSPGQLRAPGLLELEELLGDYLDTRVKIALGGKQGKVSIDFADLEDLERIYRLITEGRPAGRKKTG
jgi:ParB family transcriptional regulator, chromosome partitioning protein